MEGNEGGDRKKKRNKQGEGSEEREIRGAWKVEAAYNYHFLCIKTFRCARAAAQDP